MKIDSYLSGVLLVVGTDILTILGLVAVRRFLRSTGRLTDHDVGGSLFQVAGTMYAVNLGLIVVDAMDRFHEASRTTASEASALANLIMLSNGLGPEARGRIQACASAYADRVVDDEWPVMDLGRHAPEARAAGVRLITTVTSFEPKGEREQAIYASMLTAAGELWNARRQRTSRGVNAVPALEWVVLIGGGVVTVVFTYFFRLRQWRTQVAMTSMVSTVIALNIYLVLMFGYPYSGDLKVSPDGFVVAKSIIEHPAVARAASP
ncbi:MAG TPA: hypothetical protein VGH33_20855 [Isosphaeraceae bacterium]